MVTLNPVLHVEQMLEWKLMLAEIYTKDLDTFKKRAFELVSRILSWT